MLERPHVPDLGDKIHATVRRTGRKQNNIHLFRQHSRTLLPIKASSSR